MGFLKSLGKIAGIAGPIASFIPGGQAIGAGLTALGSLSAGQEQNESSAKAAAVANQFTERQLRNRHQWEVQDLQKAGLNPLLSVNAGGPIGSSAVAQVPSKPGAEAIATALQFKRAQAEIDLLNEQAKKTKEEAQSVRSSNVGKSTAARIWSDFLEPARRNAMGVLNSGERMVHSAGKLAGAVRRSTVNNAIGGRHFMTDAKGNTYNYPPRKGN